MPDTHHAGAYAALMIAFVIEQAIEIIERHFVWACGLIDKTPSTAGLKKAVLKVVSAGLGLLSAWILGVDILASSEIGDGYNPRDIGTAIAVAGSRECVNSILKYAGYTKGTRDRSVLQAGPKRARTSFRRLPASSEWICVVWAVPLGALTSFGTTGSA